MFLSLTIPAPLMRADLTRPPYREQTCLRLCVCVVYRFNLMGIMVDGESVLIATVGRLELQTIPIYSYSHALIDQLKTDLGCKAPGVGRAGICCTILRIVQA